MLNNLKTSLLSVVACFFTVIAMSGASTTSMWFVYESDIPKSIKKDL